MRLFPWRLGWATPYRHGAWLFNQPAPRMAIRPFPGQSWTAWTHSRVAQSTLLRNVLPTPPLQEPVEVARDPRSLHFACAGSSLRYHFLSSAQKQGLNASTPSGYHRRMDVSRWCSTLTVWKRFQDRYPVGVFLSPAPATVGRLHNLIQPRRSFSYPAAISGLQMFRAKRTAEAKRQARTRRLQQIQALGQQIPFAQSPVPTGGYFLGASFGQVAPPSQDGRGHFQLNGPFIYQNQEDPGFLNTIDIYLLGGYEVNLGADSKEYHACNWNGPEDSGNCSIYKVRWSYRFHEVISAERVLANELKPEQDEAYTYKHPGLNPTGRYLSFGSIRPGNPKLKNGEILDLETGERIVGATPVPTSNDPLWSDFAKGAAVGGIVWYDRNTLLWTNGAEYKTTDRSGEEVTCEAGSISGAEFHRDPMRVEKQGVLRGPLAYQGIINYKIRDSLFPFQQVQDPKVHPNAKSATGAWLGPRVAVMGGEGLCEGPEGSIESGFVISLENEDLFEEIEIPTDENGDPDGSMQHCSFNYTGNKVQCTRQQTTEKLTINGNRGTVKPLYGFEWINGKWESRGHLFDPDLGLTDKFPHEFPKFTNKDSANQPQCRSLTYKAASWCGHDDWMIVPTFCSDENWIRTVWGDELAQNGGELANGEPINHMLTIACRLLILDLKNLPDAVWDLTDGLSKFGLAPVAGFFPDGTVTTFSTWHGTCGAPFVKAGRWSWAPQW